MGVRVILILMFLVAACGGPSPADVAMAKSATYNQSPAWILERVETAAEESYKVHSVDPVANRLITEPQWYSPEGDRESPGAGDRVNARGGSVQVWFVVDVVEVDGAPGEGAHHAVTVTPKTMQLISWSPKPRELLPDDPNLPPWIHGRVDNLAFEIHEQLIRKP
jgi:hypothetical protein